MKSNPVIEIRGAGFVNKGAELMFLAVQRELRTLYPDARITMIPKSVHVPYEKLQQFDIYPKFEFDFRGIDITWVGYCIPGRLRKLLGIVLPSEVDVVIDVSGFGLGDQWGKLGAKRALRHASRYNRWARRGAEIFLLPQALGPFTRHGWSEVMKKISASAKLIFARDRQSLEYLKEAVGEHPAAKVLLAPDFTCLVKPDSEVVNSISLADKTVAIIPNNKMYEMGAESSGGSYARVLNMFIAKLRGDGYYPVFLIHEGKGDRQIAETLNTELDAPLEILQPEDAILAKALIGKCHAVIGSRFHGLVSAVAQGIPAMAIGWSHKYEELFRDYGCSEMIVSLDDSAETHTSALDRLVEPSSNQALRTILAASAESNILASREMFGIISEELKAL